MEEYIMNKVASHLDVELIQELFNALRLPFDNSTELTLKVEPGCVVKVTVDYMVTKESLKEVTAILEKVKKGEIQYFEGDVKLK